MQAISTIAGSVSDLDRADVDTDQIIPKQFLKRIERTGFGEFLFFDWAKEPGWELARNPILTAGRNFGCGSSREHAPWAIEDYGFRAVVAPSSRRRSSASISNGTLRPAKRTSWASRSIAPSPAAASARTSGSASTTASSPIFMQLL